jgi:tetratricopeptide (TPR) repeat protein
MKKLTYLILVVLLIYHPSTIFSQKNDKARDLYYEAKTLLSNDEDESATEKFQKAIDLELKEKEADIEFLGLCYYNSAVGYFSLKEYLKSLEYLNTALKYYRQDNNNFRIRETIESLSIVYSYVDYENIKLPDCNGEIIKTEVYFVIKEIIKRSNDTVWVRFEGGDNDLLKHESTGQAVSVYNEDVRPDLGKKITGWDDRGNYVLGSAHFSEIGDNSSTCYIVVSNLKDEKYNVYEKDMVVFFCNIPKIDYPSTFRELGSVNIQFNNMDGDAIFIPRQMILNNDEQFEKEIVMYMLDDVVESGKMLKDEYLASNPEWNEPLADGRFKGTGMLDAMINSNEDDIYAFMNFVRSFPGKYLGKDWKINETYATWLINFTPLGEYDPVLFERLITQEESDFTEFIERNKYYIDDTALVRWENQVYNLIDKKEFEQAEDLVKKLLRVAEIIGRADYEAVYQQVWGNVYFNQEEWEKSIPYYDMALEKDDENLNALFYRGYAYSQLENYYLAVKDYKRLTEISPNLAIGYGNQGWYLLLDGKIFDALEVCKKAYELDSFEMSHAVNLGHAYFLTGKPGKAHYYYERNMELLEKPADFWGGAIGDYNIFIEKGWMPEEFKNLKVQYAEKFNKNYKFHLLADSISNVALEFKNNKDYENAAVTMLKAYEYENKSLSPRPYWLYWQSSWIGYFYQQMKDFENSEDYYKQSLDITINQLKDDEKIANVYDLMAWMYKDMGEYSKYYSFQEQSDALLKKFEEEQKSRRLYLVSIGNNSLNDISYKYADNDARSITEIFQNNSKNFDSIVVYEILSMDLNFMTIDKAIKEIIIDSKPDDVFVFYMAGVANTDTNDFNIRLKDNIELSSNTLKTWFASVQARNQLIILDMFAPTFVKDLMSKNETENDIFTSSDLNQNIITPSGHRIEIDSLENGLYTYYLLEAMKGKVPELLNDKQISVNDLNTHLSEQLKKDRNYFSYNYYFSGNDYNLINYDSNFSKAENLVAKRGASITQTSTQRNYNTYYSDDGKDYALLFATDEYDEWGNLVNPINDAETIGKTLEDFYGFEVEIITNASKTEVLSKIREYQKKRFGPNDQLFIFFAGHGSYDSISGEGYIVCKDSKMDDEIKTSYIPYSYLRENVNNIKTCNHILISLDVCFGGTFDKRVSSAGRGNDQYNQISKDEYIKRVKQFKTRLFITSGSKEYVSDGEPGKHSPFAYNILDVLRSSSLHNGYVTFNALVRSVERLHTTPRYGDFGDNEPGSEFIFNVQQQKANQAVKEKELN